MPRRFAPRNDRGAVVAATIENRVIPSLRQQAWESVIFLCCRIQHVFDEDAVAHGGVIYQNVGHCAHQSAVLDDGTAGHADVK